MSTEGSNDSTRDAGLGAFIGRAMKRSPSKEACWDFYAAVLGAWRDGFFENVELIDAGNGKVVQHVRAEMQGKTSGASVVFSYWLASTFRNGKVLRVEWFTDRREALEAVGLRE